jgi:hypothetical protein
MSADDLAALAEAAGLVLPADRRALVAPALSGVLAQLDLLDRVDLGETPPTNAFDARWRTRP